jgi:hypothetical protein
MALLVLFEEVDVLKRQLKPEKIASSKKRKDEYIFSSEISGVNSALVVMKVRSRRTCLLLLNPLVL